jgi:hypothetical protein
MNFHYGQLECSNIKKSDYWELRPKGAEDSIFRPLTTADMQAHALFPRLPRGVVDADYFRYVSKKKTGRP